MAKHLLHTRSSPFNYFHHLSSHFFKNLWKILHWTLPLHLSLLILPDLTLICQVTGLHTELHVVLVSKHKGSKAVLTAPKDSLSLSFAPQLGSGSFAPAPVCSALAKAQIQRARETQMLGWRRGLTLSQASEEEESLPSPRNLWADHREPQQDTDSCWTAKKAWRKACIDKQNIFDF